MSKDIVEYERHGNKVWVREDLKGHHRDFCLCYECAKFDPEHRGLNCPKANRIFAFCVQEGMVLPVWECPNFRPRQERPAGLF